MQRLRSVGMCLLFAVGFAASAAGAASGATGFVSSWGANGAGELGIGSLVNSSDPSPVAAGGTVQAVSAGGNHSLALLSSGDVLAWGENKQGELGDGSTANAEVPVPVSGLSGVTAIAAGGEHSLALLANGTVMAWGDNARGQLGNDSITSSDVPVAVQGLSGVVAIAAGGEHSLALLSNGTVKAWGADGEGQLGNGVTTNGELLPVAVSGLSAVKQIAAGGNHSLALLSSGSAEAWGENSKGQLGNGTTTASDIPVAVKTLTGISQVAAGTYHSLALLSGGTVMAWGADGTGQLGDGEKTSTDEPVAVKELSGVTSVAAGSAFSEALLSGGTMVSWGGNAEGELGDGASSGSLVPVAVVGVDEVKAIAAGSAHALALGPELPAVTAVSPNAGPPAGQTHVTITGSDLGAVTAVRFGSLAAVSFKVESATSIVAVSPEGSGDVDVRVVNAGGTSPATSADRFSYLPVVTGVSPSSGPQSGNTPVVISGSNLTGATAVRFGTAEAVKFTVESASRILATSPAGVAVVDVTVTTAGGTSELVPADRFTYTGAPPEIGRCVKVARGAAGAYSNPACTEGSASGRYEWEPGPGSKPTFNIKAAKGATIALQTVAGAEVTCRSEKGAGEYSGARTLAGVTLSLSGCVTGRERCTTAGAGEGEIRTRTLTGELGIIAKGSSGASGDELGFDFAAASPGAITEFSCGTVAQVWTGSVIVPVKANSASSSPALKFSASKGLQKPELFEGQAKDVLQAAIGGAAAVQGGLILSVTLSGKEKIELNSVA